MTSALVYLNAPEGAHSLLADLEAVGISQLAAPVECGKLVQQAILHAPDVVVCYDPLPGEALFKALRMLADTAPRPVLLFTLDGDAGLLATALDSGVHAYVVNGYGRHRLRPLLQLAQARFGREQALREQLADLGSRLDERKIVERAKGVLMRARQVSDDDAFKMLRTASMHTNQRLGQVSQHIVHSALFADSVNRAGQLRMLSQRLVKLHLLQRAGASAALCAERQLQSTQRIEDNMQVLGKNLSAPTYGDLLDQAGRHWAGLKKGLLPAPKGAAAASLLALDALAEDLLLQAERLAGVLEGAGAVQPLHILNVAGRQRMLSQRYAKFAVLALLGDKEEKKRAQAGMAEVQGAFEQAMHHLADIPLTSADIRTSLATASGLWQQMVASSAALQRGPGLDALAGASEELLEVFENLSAQYEHSMQMLMG